MIFHILHRLTMFSHLRHLQRTPLMDDRSVLISSCVALVAIATEGTALHDTRITLIVLYEVLEEKVSPAYCLMRFTILSRLMVL